MAKNLTLQDYCRAAERLNCEVSAIKAVARVESAGRGFDSKGRPKILFERHKFAKYTKGKYTKTHPHICNWEPGGYGRSAAQYGRFSEAFELDKHAAMKSASWGKFQIMGFNHRLAGFKTVDAFVDAMKISEGHQLMAFVEFIISSRLDDELRRKDWARFARGYNGVNYHINAYDKKMAKFDRQYKGLVCPPAEPEKDEKPVTEQPESASPSTAPAVPPSPHPTSGILDKAEDVQKQVQRVSSVLDTAAEAGGRIGGVSKSSWATTFLTWICGLGLQVRSFAEANPVVIAALILTGTAMLGVGVWYLTRSKERDVLRGGQ